MKARLVAVVLYSQGRAKLMGSGVDGQEPTSSPPLVDVPDLIASTSLSPAVSSIEWETLG